LERALVACCGTGGSSSSTATTRTHSEHHHHHLNPDASYAPGVLIRDRIPHFVGLVAMHCHTVASRALVLAILQVAIEMDVSDQEHEEERLKQYNEDEDENEIDDDTENMNICIDEDKNKNLEVKEESALAEHNQTLQGAIDHDDGTTKTSDLLLDKAPSDANQPKSNDTTAAATTAAATVVVERMHPKFVRPRRELLPSRIHMFIQAGGLQILAQWFKDCTTPQKVKTVTTGKKQITKSKAKQQQQQSTTTTTTTVLASSFGKLLIPILQFLQQIPVDRTVKKIIRRLKFHNDIMTLRKELKNLVTAWEEEHTNGDKSLSSTFIDPLVQRRTDPKSGGLPVVDVLMEANKLWDIWKEKDDQLKSSNKSNETNIQYKISPNPFADLLSKIEDRLHVLQEYEGVDSRTKKVTAETTDAKTSSVTTNDKPHQPLWLKNIIEQRKKAKLKNDADQKVKEQTANNRKLTVQYREQLERAREQKVMNEINKAKLEETRREKNKILQQMREKEAARIRMQEQQVQSNSLTVTKKSSQRLVKWKDGLTGLSSSVNKDLLEEVRIFTPNVWTEPPTKVDGQDDNYTTDNIQIENQEDEHLNSRNDEQNGTDTVFNIDEEQNDVDHQNHEFGTYDSTSDGKLPNGTTFGQYNMNDDDDDDDDEDDADYEENEVTVLENPPIRRKFNFR
jgi:hypothetical protein